MCQIGYRFIECGTAFSRRAIPCPCDAMVSVTNVPGRACGDPRECQRCQQRMWDALDRDRMEYQKFAYNPEMSHRATGHYDCPATICEDPSHEGQNWPYTKRLRDNGVGEMNDLEFEKRDGGTMVVKSAEVARMVENLEGNLERMMSRREREKEVARTR